VKQADAVEVEKSFILVDIASLMPPMKLITPMKIV
jgi:hypothetical protein